MDRSGVSETRFRVAALLILVLLTLFQNALIFDGFVPIPADLSVRYPLWSFNKTRPAADPTRDNRLGDKIYQFYPWFEFAGRSIREGTLPLWNPHSLLGTPFQAATQTRVFYPVTILYVLFPTALAWTLHNLLVPVLAGFFCLLFARSIHLSRTGALVASMTFAFSGFMAIWNGWPLADSALWLPLTFYATQRLHHRISFANISLLAFAIALSFLGGNPTVAPTIGVAVALFAIFRLRIGQDGPAAPRRDFARSFLFAVFLALALSAIQSLPLLEWGGQTARSAVASDYGRWHIRSSQFPAFLSRDIQADPTNADMNLPDEAIYPGVLALLLAAHAFLSRRGDALFFALLAVLAIEIMFGWGLPYWLSSHVPGFAAFNNKRFLLLASFSIAILAGLGLTRLQERWRASGPAEKQWWASWLIGCAVLVLGTVHLWERFLGTSHGDRRWLYSPASTALLLVIGALLCAPFLKRVRGLSIAIVAVIALDLISYGYRPATFSPAGILLPEPEALAMIRRSGHANDRILGVEYAVPFNYETLAGLFSPAGYDYPLQRTAKLLDFVSAGEQWTDFLVETLQRDPNRLLDLMNVRYVIVNQRQKPERLLQQSPGRFRLYWSDENVAVFENSRVLPRAFAVPATRATVIQDDKIALEKVTDQSFDPGRDVVVDRPLTFAPAATGNTGAAGFKQRNNTIDVSLAVGEPSVLVVSDAWYPGWKVRVNGLEHQLLRTDYAFKGVALAPGSHNVHFYFRPLSFMAGAAITLLTLAGMVAALLRSNADKFRQASSKSRKS